jgi:hypothetical protein
MLARYRLGAQESVDLGLSDELDRWQEGHGPHGGMLLWWVLMSMGCAEEAKKTQR